MRIPVVLATVCCLCQAGCDFTGGALELGVSLPELPPLWAAAFGDAGYGVRWRDPAGRVQSMSGEPWVTGELPRTITVTAGAYTPVVGLVRGAWGEGALKPAGALVPMDVVPDGMVLALSFEQGPAACVLERLLGRAAALSPGGPDVEGIARDILDAGDGDPWRVDLDGLVASVLRGEQACRRLVSAPVSSPADMRLVWDDPFAPMLAPGDPPLDTPVGFHRLYPCDEAGKWTGGRVDLWLDRWEAVWLPH